MDSLSLQFVEYDSKTGKTKVNASVNYMLAYELNDSLQAKIKNHILGKDAKEAEAYLQTLPEISEVQIKTWPFWVKSVPGVASNIEIRQADE